MRAVVLHLKRRRDTACHRPWHRAPATARPIQLRNSSPSFSDELSFSTHDSVHFLDQEKGRSAGSERALGTHGGRGDDDSFRHGIRDDGHRRNDAQRRRLRVGDGGGGGGGAVGLALERVRRAWQRAPRAGELRRPVVLRRVGDICAERSGLRSGDDRTSTGGRRGTGGRGGTDSSSPCRRG